jgi:hypothetical protein
MSNDKKNKPIWNKNQVAKVKRYLQSDDFSKRMKEFNEKFEEEERQRIQEEIEWWNRIKDEPYMLCK